MRGLRDLTSTSANPRPLREPTRRAREVAFRPLIKQSGLAAVARRDRFPGLRISEVLRLRNAHPS